MFPCFGASVREEVEVEVEAGQSGSARGPMTPVRVAWRGKRDYDLKVLDSVLQGARVAQGGVVFAWIDRCHWFVRV